MNPATLRDVIKDYIRRWREARVKRLDRVIANCNATLRRIDEDEEPEWAGRLQIQRQQAAFKRVNHLNKLEKE